VASPGLFSANSTGSGQVSALNQDNSVNSASNPAARGEVIQLFGTGQGFVSGAPRDGDVATGLIPTSTMPRVFIEPDYVPDDHILYSGLAPNLIGVWQVNVRIPTERVAPGTRRIFVQHRDLASSDRGVPATTISVR
jgi:uncharacterized protein (TIGR03437 family)